MPDQLTQSEQSKTSLISQPKTIRDLILVGSPLIIMGLVGNLVGGATLLGGAIINFGYLMMIFIGAKLLKKQGVNWMKLGLRKPNSWLKTLLLGIGAAVIALIIFVAAQGAAFGVLNMFGMVPTELDQTRFNPIANNISLFVLMIVLAWTTIAFGEELFFRAFLITRMMDISNINQSSAILISGIVFGVVHFAEGPVGMLANASFGIFFGWTFVRSSRNLWITIFAHGVINTLRFSLLFVGAA